MGAHRRLRRRAASAVLLLSALLLTAGCARQTEPPAETPEAEITVQTEETDMILTIDGTQVPVQWEDNASVRALRALAPLTIEMSMYGGFEQVGPIGARLPRSDAQTTTAPGDLVLYSGDQLVVFYGTNHWAYTRLGHVALSAEELTALLGAHDVSITITEG